MKQTRYSVTLDRGMRIIVYPKQGEQPPRVGDTVGPAGTIVRVDRM